MPKDFKQRPARKKTSARASRKGARAPSRWPAFLVGVAVGAVATVLTLRYEPAHILEQAVKGAPSATGAGADEPTRFEFYTVLPEKEIAIPDTDLEETTSAPVPEPSASPTDVAPVTSAAPEPRSGERFLLQVSSSRSLEDADRLKAKLAFLGLESTIQTVKLRGETWHRVHVGPVRGRAELAEARRRLQDNEFESLVLKLK